MCVFVRFVVFRAVVSYAKERQQTEQANCPANCLQRCTEMRDVSNEVYPPPLLASPRLSLPIFHPHAPFLLLSPSFHHFILSFVVFVCTFPASRAWRFLCLRPLLDARKHLKSVAGLVGLVVSTLSVISEIAALPGIFPPRAIYCFEFYLPFILCTTWSAH